MSASHIPPCKNPDHPEGVDRSRGMVVLEESDDRVVFACKACKELNKRLSVQVVTLPRGWAAAKYKNQIAGVERVDKYMRNFKRPRIRYRREDD